LHRAELSRNKRCLCGWRSKRNFRLGLTASSAWTCTQPNLGSCLRCTPATFSCGIQRQVRSSNHGRYANCPYAPANSLRVAPNLFAHPMTCDYGSITTTQWKKSRIWRLTPIISASSRFIQPCPTFYLHQMTCPSSCGTGNRIGTAHHLSKVTHIML